MRISPISNYSVLQSHNKKNVNFKGFYETEYNDEVERIAQKYQYVKNPYNSVYDELSLIYVDWRASSETSEILKRIDALKLKHSESDTILEALDKTINAKNKDLDAENLEQKRLASSISETKKKNAVDKIKASKLLASFDRVSETEDQLKTKYIDLFKIEGEKKFPNAILISGLQNDEEKQKVLNYLNANDCVVLKMNFGNITMKEAVKGIFELSKKIKNSGKHSILYIDNFDKYTIPSEKNEYLISKLKGFMSTLIQDYDATMLVFENNPERLDENIIGGHRFEKKIDVSNIKEKVPSVFYPKYDGYTMFYGGEKDDYIDLYLGDSGQNPKILWADSRDYSKIKAILPRIEEIKKTDKFHNIEYIQIPYADSYCFADKFYPVEPRRYTSFGDIIFERKI